MGHRCAGTEGNVFEVKLLDILERSMERLIHGPVDSVFRQDLQPAEIERRLERAMLDNSRRASGSSIMPNHFSVKLSEHDFASIEPYLGSLIRRLESWLANRAEAHNGTLLGRLQIEVTPSSDVKRRRLAIDARITDINLSHSPGGRSAGEPPADATQMFSVRRPQPTVSLRVLNGAQAGNTFSIGQGHSIVGRSHEADIRIDSLDVSRKHVRIIREGGAVRLNDLDSTNGTRVNGEPVRTATLRNGDEVLIGTQALRLVIES